MDPYTPHEIGGSTNLSSDTKTNIVAGTVTQPVEDVAIEDASVFARFIANY